MPKAKQKTVQVSVTAKFEVTFIRKVTEEQFKQLETAGVSIDEIVDESEAYDALRSAGECEMEWDYVNK